MGVLATSEPWISGETISHVRTPTARLPRQSGFGRPASVAGNYNDSNSDRRSNVAMIRNGASTPQPDLARSQSTKQEKSWPGLKASKVLGISASEVNASKRKLSNSNSGKRDTAKPSMFGLFNMSSLGGLKKSEPIKPASQAFSAPQSPRLPSRASSVKTSKTTPRSPTISSPTNFKHITHTRPQDFRKLGTASENDLLAEFSAVRAAQTSRQHVHGIKCSELSSRTSLVDDSTSPPSLASDSSRSSVHSPRTSVPPPARRHVRALRSKESFSMPFRDGHPRCRNNGEPLTPMDSPCLPGPPDRGQDLRPTPMTDTKHAGLGLADVEERQDWTWAKVEPKMYEREEEEQGYFHAQSSNPDAEWQTPMPIPNEYTTALWAVDEERASLEQGRSQPEEFAESTPYSQATSYQPDRMPLRPTYTQSTRPPVALSQYNLVRSMTEPHPGMRPDLVKIESSEDLRVSLSRSSLTGGLFSSWSADSDCGSVAGDENACSDPLSRVAVARLQELQTSKPAMNRSGTWPERPQFPPPSHPLPAIPSTDSINSSLLHCTPMAPSLPNLEPTTVEPPPAPKSSSIPFQLEEQPLIETDAPCSMAQYANDDIKKTAAASAFESAQPQPRPAISRRRKSSVKSVRFKDDMCSFMSIERHPDSEPEAAAELGHVQANLEDLQETLRKLELEMSRSPSRSDAHNATFERPFSRPSQAASENSNSKRRKTDTPSAPRIMPRTSSLSRHVIEHRQLQRASSNGNMSRPSTMENAKAQMPSIMV